MFKKLTIIFWFCYLIQICHGQTIIIGGYVTNEIDSPLNGVAVSIINIPIRYTISSGEFQLNVPNTFMGKPVNIHFSLDNYYTDTSILVLEQDLMKTLFIKLKPKNKPDYFIVGQVKLSSDQATPIEGVTVRCIGLLDSTLTKRDGTFYLRINDPHFGKRTREVNLQFSKAGYVTKSKMDTVSNNPFEHTLYIFMDNIVKPVIDYRYQLELLTCFNTAKTSEYIGGFYVQRKIANNWYVGVGFLRTSSVYKVQYSTLPGLPPIINDTTAVTFPFGIGGKFELFNKKVISPTIGSFLSFRFQQISVACRLKIIPKFYINLYGNVSNSRFELPIYKFNMLGNSEISYSWVTRQKFSIGIALDFNFNINAYYESN